MNQRLSINLCVIQPSGSLPMQGLNMLDAALYFQHQFSRLGAEVTLTKNRLIRDGVNLVFGAHLGFDAALKRDHTCLFVNLESLVEPHRAPLAYLDLLRHSLVIDYSAANIAAYSRWPEDVPLVSFGHAPYVPAARTDARSLAARPIDLLFIGTLNERRARLIARIEAMGRRVTTLSTPLYGPERNRLVAQARGVLMCHPVAGQPLDPVQAFQMLSAGTPVVAERSQASDDALDLCTLWFDELQLERYFADEYGTALYFDVAAKALDVYRQADPVEAYADCLAFVLGVHKVALARHHGIARPARTFRRVHLGAGCDYRPGWLNIHPDELTAPDVVLDLSRPQAWPLSIQSPWVGTETLHAESVDELHAGDMLVQTCDLRGLMTNCLALLRTGGRLTATVPHERAPSAWQDPDHVRAMNDHSWRSWTDRFWTQGWFTHRFERTAFTYLDHRRLPCDRDAAWFMQVALTKVETTLAERAQARHQRADFGPLYADASAQAWHPVDPQAGMEATPDTKPAPISTVT